MNAIKTLTLIGAITFLCLTQTACQRMNRSDVPDQYIPTSAQMASLISQGDILRTAAPEPGQTWLPLYQGNGRCGSCFGPWGLHVPADKKRPYTVHGKTQLMHMQHFARLTFGMDYLLPLAEIRWQSEPEHVNIYSQHQSFYDGTINTHFETPDYTITIESWFDPVSRDTLGFMIDAQGACPPVIVAPYTKLDVHYKQTVEPTFTSHLADNVWRSTIRCASAKTQLTVTSTADMSTINEGLKIELRPGRNFILIAAGELPDISPLKSMQQSRTGWQNGWLRTGWLELPDTRAQQVWIRSLAYILYSYGDDGFGPAPPTGLAGNGWPFPFPEDLSFVHPVLLATGHENIPKAWTEFWKNQIPGYLDYTRRRFNAQGIMMPWNTPYGSMTGFHHAGPPNHCSNEIHNSAYVTRIARETADMVDDWYWTRTNAVPFILETARFYRSILHKENDNLWHLEVYPSMGQDEFGGDNQTDYLCALFSAQYCMQQAINYGLDADGDFQKVLTQGLAFPSLLSDQGLYYSCRGLGQHDFGKQKHPVQLNPLAFLPIADSPDDPTRQAYSRRYDIIENANNDNFPGWTLGEFILASAHMPDVAGWQKDWSRIQPSQNADPDWIQFYESSGRTKIPFYITTHGFFAGALLDAIVNSYWNRLDIAPCIPWPGRVRFGHIKSPLGVTVSGDLTAGKGVVWLTAWKDAQFLCQGQTIKLKKGKTITLPINH